MPDRILMTLYISLAVGFVLGFFVGNHGPVYATGYITGQLNLVSKLAEAFPHDSNIRSYKSISGINVKDRSIRIIEKNGVKTLDVE